MALLRLCGHFHVKAVCAPWSRGGSVPPPLIGSAGSSVTAKEPISPLTPPPSPSSSPWTLNSISSATVQHSCRRISRWSPANPANPAKPRP
ncbi:hypothetical protein JOB18_000187 [Solea senegalensis]|uniref:Uncharacterized protein n=1 Tax=Solea senegalensis TaxID=28829 RepID=A0AAV6PF81_SOLSE|nr:hypothetical protein JOB18_000187 [Solea senegalensis]